MKLIIQFKERMIILLGTIQYITENMNGQPWQLGIYSGLKFEKYIFDIICHVLNPLFPHGISIYETPNTRDDGKDIVIESMISFQLFGVDFPLKGKKKIKIHIECKSSNEKKIDLDKFSKNLIIANHDEIDYLVLVTNTTISPFSYYQASECSKDYNYEFILIDQYLLYLFLKNNNALIGKYLPPDTINELSVSYQICKGRLNGKPCFDLYLFMHNNSNKPSLCSFKLKSDRNWHLSNSEFEIFLHTHRAQCKKIIVEKEYFDGIDDIIIEFNLNKVRKIIEISGVSLNYRFEAPLFGENHKKIITEIDQEIYNNTKFKLFHLHGNAGIGKTRIIDEIYKKAINRGIHIFYYRCIKQQKINTSKDFLKKIKETGEFSNSNSIQEAFQNVLYPFCNYLIIIEDLHNASDEFIDEIDNLRTLSSTRVPISILLTGRDDYTVYNERYFIFCDMLSHKKQINFSDIEVQPLSDYECISLIQTIIDDIPEYILKKIQIASQNIPFYIIQFIEYMLDTDILYLINRNTVGISNITTFNQKIYIPKSVEEIIRRRFQNLCHNKRGSDMQTFLLFLAYFEAEFDKKYIIEFFDDSVIDEVQFLFENHFLKISNYNNIIFDHENIILFLQKQLKNPDILKKISKVIFTHPQLFEQLSNLKKGRIYYILNDHKNAIIYYKQPIMEIEQMDNISSENLNALYYDYLGDIYEIQRRQKKEEMQKKTILASLYLAMHNQDNGKAVKTFEKIWELIVKYHKNDPELIISFEQLQAHFYMQNGILTKAQKGMNELIAKERSNPELFSDEVRFNLFDRFSSLNLQYNHKTPAFLYNNLSKQLAESMHNTRLQTLSIMTEAKIHFYEKPDLSFDLMLKARELLNVEKVERIFCHNELSILTTEILLKKNSYENLIKRALYLLEFSIDKRFPSAEIRIHFLLAVLYYLQNYSIENSKRHIEASIKLSLKYGNAKLMAPIYNLKAIIGTYENQNTEKIYKYYATMMQYLKQQNLLFLGALDFGYGNILNLTNYAKFLNEYGLESELYRMMSEISYYGSEVLCDFNCNSNRHCYYSCQKNIEVFKENCERLKKNGLLFLDKKYTFDLKDEKTEYLIPIGV